MQVIDESTLGKRQEFSITVITSTLHYIVANLEEAGKDPLIVHTEGAGLNFEQIMQECNFLRDGKKFFGRILLEDFELTKISSTGSKSIILEGTAVPVLSDCKEVYEDERKTET